MAESDTEIAKKFMRRWEQAWNEEGSKAVALLYTIDAILVANITSMGRAQIESLFEGIIEQGYTRMRLKLIAVRRIGDVIVVANSYIASGSDAEMGKMFEAKSSHVLICRNGEWLSAMHTAA